MECDGQCEQIESWISGGVWDTARPVADGLAADCCPRATSQPKIDQHQPTFFNDDQVFRLRMQQGTGQGDVPNKMRLIRRERARVKTLLREQELAAEGKR